MDKKTSSAPSIWRVNLTPAVIGLIPAAVGINYVAKAFAEGLKLPVWLGSLGTYLASMLAGPIPGAISGFINNVIYGLTLSPVSTVYALTSIGIGIAVGVLHAKGGFSSARKIFVSALIIALVSSVISTPLNVIFWGGQTGIAWGIRCLPFWSQITFRCLLLLLLTNLFWISWTRLS